MSVVISYSFPESKYYLEKKDKKELIEYDRLWNMAVKHLWIVIMKIYLREKLIGKKREECIKIK